MEKIAENIDNSVHYKKVSKYPKIERDVAFFVPMEFAVEEAKKIISEVLPAEAIELKLFDIYKDIENNRKSFGFRISLQSDEKTLSDEFANEVMEKVYSVLEKENFEIR
jgi:phenylalanyl-tRNA synthetase beta chain